MAIDNLLWGYALKVAIHKKELEHLFAAVGHTRVATIFPIPIPSVQTARTAGRSAEKGGPGLSITMHLHNSTLYFVDLLRGLSTPALPINVDPDVNVGLHSHGMRPDKLAVISKERKVFDPALELTLLRWVDLANVNGASHNVVSDSDREFVELVIDRFHLVLVADLDKYIQEQCNKYKLMYTN